MTPLDINRRLRKQREKANLAHPLFMAGGWWGEWTPFSSIDSCIVWLKPLQPACIYQCCILRWPEKEKKNCVLQCFAIWPQRVRKCTQWMRIAKTLTSIRVYYEIFVLFTPWKLTSILCKFCAVKCERTDHFVCSIGLTNILMFQGVCN